MKQRNVCPDAFISAFLVAILSIGIFSCGERPLRLPSEQQIIPLPKRAEYYRTTVPLADVATGETHLNVEIHPENSPLLTYGVQLLEADLARIAGKSLRRAPPGPNTGITLRAVALDEVTESKKFLQTKPSEAWDRPEGYTVHFAKSDTGWLVEVVGADERGAFYGVQSLRQLLTYENRRVVLRRAEIEDWPTFRLRGFKSQAFEGQMWSMNDALLAAHWAPTVKFNAFSPCYTHLPDFYHPSREYMSFLDSLLSFASRTHALEIVPEVNPYYGRTIVEISNPRHVAALIRLFDHSLERGARRVMLQLDDFAKLPAADKKVYATLAEANADLIKRLRNQLLPKYPDCELWVCTPVYFHPRNEVESEYLAELSKLIPRDVHIIWTGKVVTTLCQKGEDIQEYQRMVGGRRLVYWDNSLKYPPGWQNVFRCNAFMIGCKSPETYDWQTLMEATEARFIANTYGPSELYKIPLATVADFLWNPEAYSPKESFARAAYHYDPTDHKLGGMLIDFANHFHQRVLTLREEICKNPTDSLLAQLELAVDSLTRAYQVISSRSSNRVLLNQLGPYVERHTLAMPYFRQLAAAAKKPRSEFADALRNEIIPGLTAVRDRLLKRKGEGEHKYGVFSRSALENRNLKALEELTAKLVSSK